MSSIAGSIKVHPVLKPNFEVVITFMSAMLVFPVSPEIYNSFDILFVCFFDLMNEL